jgi:hypothetical protein
MSTLEDAILRFKKEEAYWNLFGCSVEWEQKVFDAFKKIGTAILEDRGISTEEAMSLPRDTELGPKAEEAYAELIALIDTEKRRMEKI